MPRVLQAALVVWLLLTSAVLAERINHEGRILGPAPTITTPILFNTPEADAVVGIREVEKLEGESLSLEAMRRHYLSMESWSQLVFDDLVGDALDRAERSPLVVDLPAVP